MKVLKTIRVQASKGSGRLLPTLALTCLFIFLLCLNSYAGNAENLIRAAWQGDISTVKALLVKGTDVNAEDNRGTTALIAASAMGHSEVVKVLLDKNADVTVKNNKGETALKLARTHDIAQLLIKAGAKE